jgi:hypothetical protein
LSAIRWSSRALMLTAAVLLAPHLAASAQPVAGGADRIVAVGDVHGSYDGLTGILRTAGLIDADGHWSGGSATFVQTGDLLDRGTRLREVLDLLAGDRAPRQPRGHEPARHHP